MTDVLSKVCATRYATLARTVLTQCFDWTSAKSNRPAPGAVALDTAATSRMRYKSTEEVYDCLESARKLYMFLLPSKQTAMIFAVT